MKRSEATYLLGAVALGAGWGWLIEKLAHHGHEMASLPEVAAVGVIVGVTVGLAMGGVMAGIRWLFA